MRVYECICVYMRVYVNIPPRVIVLSIRFQKKFLATEVSLHKFALSLSAYICAEAFSNQLYEQRIQRKRNALDN